MNSKQSGRRRFLKEGAALAGLAVGAVRSARGQTLGSEIPAARAKDLRAYGEPSRFEKAARADLLTPLQDTLGIITPAALHFEVIRYRSGPPDIDPRQHRLLIHGLVDRPLIFTVEELKRLPSVSRIHFVECAGNSSPIEVVTVLGRRKSETVQQVHGLTACSEWTGVQLSLLLKEAGVQKGAGWLLAEGAEPGQHTKSIPLEKAMEDVLVAYGQNGEAVRPEQGYPFRLLVPGWEGVSNVKWLRRIKVVDRPYMTKMESTGYVALWPSLGGKGRWFNFEMGPKSVITFPSGGHRLPGRGFYEITGLAWSGRGAIRRVEVSTDGGRSWKDAQLQEPVHRMAHARFRLPWNWEGEEAVLQSRCTDDQGDVQPSLAEFARTWGVKPDYFQATSNRVNHFNSIYPWKVTREGSVRNALFS
ncbi:MAG: sulfite dehydrogenase [Acidobacteria bacterium RIFCSPLOWO2_12_FULL_60_22]|nr:MAG: sulfite dehydrogenase [Acidobacteria bacterium RIFCSPLOWO2_12_FULL_60_22]